VTDPVAHARAEWESARRAAQAVLREPGGLPERNRELLRLSVLPQIEAALAALEEDFTPAELVQANSFLPLAIESLAEDSGLDPGLAGVSDHMRRGLDALAR
jgi:hypothetical protein